MDRPEQQPREVPSSETRLFWLLASAVALVLVACFRAIFFTPDDAMLGAAQKIFYVHLPVAIVGMYFACGLLAFASVGFLWLRDQRLDRLGEASAEVGLLFLTIVLLTGPIWARASWGAWWVWDARITSTLFLWLLLLAYGVLRSAFDTQEARARLCAVMGVMAALLVPFIHVTVKLFRGMHPGPIVLKPEKPTLPPSMQITFGLAMIAFIALFVAILALRMRMASLRDVHRNVLERDI
ncbi:MAG: cytochrome c biogenesis protein CcsA [Gemmatimonadota bacterium]